MTGSFDLLSPDSVLAAVERAFDLALDGTLDPYPSYTNRVYGLRDQDGKAYVVKFYRPGRWSEEAILDEHRFVMDCARADLPVVPPLPDADGQTLTELALDPPGGEPAGGEEHASFLFALFPRKGGRNFDAESDEDWLRLGGAAARIHAVGRGDEAPHRAVCLPQELTAAFVRELLEGEIVHPDSRGELEEICSEALETITPLFAGVPLQRVHGDCHRGNILDRPGEGLLVIDFDDMMNAPPVQDLWLLLPGLASECRRELALLVEGYELFLHLDLGTLRLIESLRFMRMVYFLAWRSRQRHDHWFARAHPEWGGRAFWIKELEDLREQLAAIRRSLDERPLLG